MKGYSLEKEEYRLCRKYGVSDIGKVLNIQSKILSGKQSKTLIIPENITK